jgi:hypothetical protein
VPSRTPDRRSEWSVSGLRVYGPLALALFMLAGSRWGSYIIPGPPYIADLVLALLAVAAVIHAAINPSSGRIRLDPTVAALGGAFLAWSLIRFGFGPLDLDALRDLAPYAYVLIVFLTFPFTAHQESLASRLITVALVAHAAWVSVTLAVGRLPFAPALGTPARHEEPVYLFDLRPDIDVPVSGLLTAISLHRALTGRHIPINLGLAAWGAALAFSMDSRAGLIAFGVQLLVVAALGVRSRQRATTPPAARAAAKLPSLLQRRLVVAALIVAAPLALYAARNSPAVERMGDVFGSGGTSAARAESWSQVAGWVTEDAGRTVVGVGLGPNYLVSTGISRTLLGGDDTREDVRSPHNYLVGTWARLGLVGLALYVLLLLATARLALLVVRAPHPLRDTDLLAILVAASIPPAAALGVLMEAPFGAIPFFWAVGHLSVRATQLGASGTFSDLIRRRPREGGPAELAPMFKARLRVIEPPGPGDPTTAKPFAKRAAAEVSDAAAGARHESVAELVAEVRHLRGELESARRRAEKAEIRAAEALRLAEQRVEEAKAGKRRAEVLAVQAGARANAAIKAAEDARNEVARYRTAAENDLAEARTQLRAKAQEQLRAAAAQLKAQAAESTKGLSEEAARKAREKALAEADGRIAEVERRAEESVAAANRKVEMAIEDAERKLRAEGERQAKTEQALARTQQRLERLVEELAREKRAREEAEAKIRSD